MNPITRKLDYFTRVFYQNEYAKELRMGNMGALLQEDYEQTLHEVTGLFYEFKNETMDIVSDDELIDFMKEAFNGFCKGSLELLAGRALPMLAEHVRSGEPLESFIYRAEQYEQS